MGNRQNCAKFQENLFRSNEIISIFCPPLFRKRPIMDVKIYMIFCGRYQKRSTLHKFLITDIFCHFDVKYTYMNLRCIDTK